MAKNIVVTLCSAACVLLLANCADPGGAESTSTNEIGVSQQAMTTAEFSWNQGQGDTLMWAKSQGYCFLTGVAGHFVGAGEQVYVTMDSTNTTWILKGQSQQQGIGGFARCISWTDLNSGRGGDFTWGNWLSSASSASSNLWALDSFCHLDGIGGWMGSTFDGSFVAPSGSVWQTTVYDTTSGQNPTMGDGACVYLRQGAGQNLALSSYTWNQGSAATVIGPVNNRFCTLRSVFGKFAGAGESVHLQQSGGNWVLGGTSQQSGVGATAYCIAIPK